MGNPAYQLVGDSAGEIVTFPRAERPGSNPIGRLGRSIRLETEDGALLVYGRPRPRIWDLHFRVNQDERDAFDTFDEAVNGDEDPFYFIEDVDSPSVAFLVRQMDANYSPAQLAESPGDGIFYYDVTLRFREEIATASISA